MTTLNPITYILDKIYKPLIDLAQANTIALKVMAQYESRVETALMNELELTPKERRQQKELSMTFLSLALMMGIEPGGLIDYRPELE